MACATLKPKRRSFTEQQYAFTAYIRDPENNPAPDDIEKRRIEMYRELFFNNIESFIATNFPVLRQIFDEKKWRDLVQDFFANHQSKAPYFQKIAEEFLDFLQNEREQQPDDPGFMLELAHYEWVEMALTIAIGEAPESDPELQNDPLATTIKLSELAWPLAYQYPVHKISTEYQPDTAPEQPTFLVVYRNSDDQVKFLEINRVTYRLLQLIQENGTIAPHDHLKQIAEELQHPDAETVVKNGIEILRGLIERKVVGRA